MDLSCSSGGVEDCRLRLSGVEVASCWFWLVRLCRELRTITVVTEEARGLLGPFTNEKQKRKIRKWLAHVQYDASWDPPMSLAGTIQCMVETR